MRGDLGPPSHGGTITFERIGAPGWYPSRRDPAVGPCDAYDSAGCCLAEQTVTSDALTPWDRDLIMTLRGPMLVEQLAVYQPRDGGSDWSLVSAWTASDANALYGCVLARQQWLVASGFGSDVPEDVTGALFAVGDGPRVLRPVARHDGGRLRDRPCHATSPLGRARDRRLPPPVVGLAARLGLAATFDIAAGPLGSRGRSCPPSRRPRAGRVRPSHGRIEDAPIGRAREHLDPDRAVEIEVPQGLARGAPPRRPEEAPSGVVPAPEGPQHEQTTDEPPSHPPSTSIQGKISMAYRIRGGESDKRRILALAIGVLPAGALLWHMSDGDLLLWLGSVVVLGLVATAVATFRLGVDVDPRRGEARRWWGPGFPLWRTAPIRYDCFDEIRVTKRVYKSTGSPTSTYYYVHLHQDDGPFDGTFLYRSSHPDTSRRFATELAEVTALRVGLRLDES